MKFGLAISALAGLASCQASHPHVRISGTALSSKKFSSSSALGADFTTHRLEVPVSYHDPESPLFNIRYHVDDKTAYDGSKEAPIMVSMGQEVSSSGVHTHFRL